MAGANSQMSLVGLDFDTIKNNLKTYLKSQDTFKDYNFDGSGLSILLDVLAYNTQYNAFYLNMTANEMFLDTALQRSSVVSHAKLLNYTPKSVTAPISYINLVVTNVTDTSLTLPSYANFLSEPVGERRITYNFITTDSTTVNTDLNTNTATFNNIQIKQGIIVNYKFTVDTVANPTYTFQLPDNSIDTNTIKVSVQQSGSNSYSSIYNLSREYLLLNSTSEVFFLNESLNGNYEISFGDGILGKKLTDGNIVKVTYLITQGKSAMGANNFTLMDTVPGFTNYVISGSIPTTQGGEKETIDSVKYQAPKSYSAQNRAVSKEDYITLIQQNNIGLTFDAVNIWGGQENDPPVYGQVFVCLKPSGSYTLTDTQKDRLISDVIKPISIMTVEPTIVDPDYTYLKLNVNVIYDTKKTNLTSNDIKLLVSNTINSFATTTLNKFNSTFSSSELTHRINVSEQSIIANEVKVQIQKKIYPNLTTPTTYKLYYGTPLNKGMFSSGVNSYPSVQFRDKINPSIIIDGIYVEELPSSTGGVESISIINAGYNYQTVPTVTIQGDGIGATAQATLTTEGKIDSIKVVTSGNNYTSAIATITPASYDTSGQGAAAVVNLYGRYGNLRTYYNNTQNVKTIYNNNAGTIEYASGIVTLDAFNPIEINEPLGQFTVSVNPSSSILSSSYNRILTLDPFDPNAITVTVTAKSQ
jgi:hypothetical protein